MNDKGQESELQARRERILSLREEYERLKKVDTKAEKQERGRGFEKLIHEVFRAHGLLLRTGYHTSQNRDEQVDGAIELPTGRIALLEAKWQESKDMAASDLFAFLGKVESKFVGTTGVFVSQPELKENFLRALRYGRRQCVAVLHGEDVESLFNPDFLLKDYLTDLFRHLSTDNVVHVPISRWDRTFFAISAHSEADGDVPEEENVEGIEELVEQCLTDRDVGQNPHEQAQALAAIDASTGFIALIKRLDGLRVGFRESWKREALEAVAIELIGHLGEAETEADRWFFGRVSGDFREDRLPSVRQEFLARWSALDPKSAERFETRLLKQWAKHFGNYYSENGLADRTHELWNHLSLDTQESIVSDYLVAIALSDRDPSFPQWRFASSVLSEQDWRDRFLWPELELRAAARVKTWKHLGDDEDTARAEMIKKFSQLSRISPDYKDAVARGVATVYE